MVPADVVEALDELITERAERGNCQSKHGLSAARSYEVWRLKEALKRLMDKEPRD